MEFNETLLKEKTKQVRRLTLKTIESIGVGHIGGCLSIAEVLALLYNGVMNIDPKNPCLQGRDRFILSKGHAGPALYAALADRGYFSEEELLTLNKPNTNLPSHCDMNKTIGVDMTAGSLGQGFSCAVGAAIGSKLKKDGATIYTIIGDGESQEGQIWEAAMYASSMKLNNFIAFTDKNGMQIDGTTDEINSVEPLDQKWVSFGFNVILVKDGHDLTEIYKAIQKAKEEKERPSMIILNTVKGKGASFAEKAGVANHSMNVTKENLEEALKELE